MSRARLAVVVLSFILFAPVANGQVTQINDTTSTPVEGAGHDYIHLLSETVNPSNGSVSLRLQLPMPKGRGLTIPFSFNYDSNGLNHIVSSPTFPGQASWLSNQDWFASGGWSYAYPSARADTWMNTVYVLTGENNGQPIYTGYNCSYMGDYLFADGTGDLHSHWKYHGLLCPWSMVSRPSGSLLSFLDLAADFPG